ncbi:hypothetical protein [Cyanobium sp. LEGE 06143]|uniref:hypothetical protein n=1 Tax=Cyanobium sp. LEGE 06143 TaxID=945727 RepID=UPI00351CB637
MRSLLAGAASAMLALTLAACGGGGGAGEGDVPTLRRGISAKVDTLDPHKSSAAWENIVIGDMMIGLTTDDANGRGFRLRLPPHPGPDGCLAIRLDAVAGEECREGEQWRAAARGNGRARD